MSPLDAANDAIRRNVSVGDYIMLSQATATKTIIGEVVSALHSEVRYCELVPMARDTMERGFVPAVDAGTVSTELITSSTIHDASREQ